MSAGNGAVAWMPAVPIVAAAADGGGLSPHYREDAREAEERGRLEGEGRYAMMVVGGDELEDESATQDPADASLEARTRPTGPGSRSTKVSRTALDQGPPRRRTHFRGDRHAVITTSSSASPSALTVHLTAEPATLDPGAVAALMGHLARQGDDLIQYCCQVAGGRGARQAEALATLLERAATGDVRAGVLLARQVRRLRDMLVPDALDASAATGPAGLDARDPHVVRRRLHAAALGRVLGGGRLMPARSLVPATPGSLVRATARLMDAPGPRLLRAA